MERRTFLKTTAAGLLVAASPLHSVFAQAKKVRIGFSQSTTLEPWRVQFNKDMKREADMHPEVELLIADGQVSRSQLPAPQPWVAHSAV